MFPDSWMSTNDLIHLRLSEGGFISFIMAPATIANQVNEYVLMKPIAVGMSYAYRHQSGLGIICIHMYYRYFKAFRQVTSKVC